MLDSGNWFRHDANASDDEKLMLLKKEFGLEAKGLYWEIIEFLCSQSDPTFPETLLCDRICAGSATALRAFQKMIELQLLHKKGERIYSKRLNFERERLENIRSKNSENAQKRWKNQKVKSDATAYAPAMPPQCDLSRSDQSRSEYKKKKGKNNPKGISASIPIGDEPTADKPGLPPELINFFISQGKEEINTNVFLTLTEVDKLRAKWGPDIFAYAVKEMGRWSVNLDINQKTNKPCWVSYRAKRDHAATIENLLKRRQDDGKIVPIGR